MTFFHRAKAFGLAHAGLHRDVRQKIAVLLIPFRDDAESAAIRGERRDAKVIAERFFQIFVFRLQPRFHIDHERTRADRALGDEEIFLALRIPEIPADRDLCLARFHQDVLRFRRHGFDGKRIALQPTIHFRKHIVFIAVHLPFFVRPSQRRLRRGNEGLHGDFSALCGGRFLLFAATRENADSDNTRCQCCQPFLSVFHNENLLQKIFI